MRGNERRLPKWPIARRFFNQGERPGCAKPFIPASGSSGTFSGPSHLLLAHNHFNMMLDLRGLYHGYIKEAMMWRIPNSHTMTPFKKK
jgi:hypothetical protein